MQEDTKNANRIYSLKNYNKMLLELFHFQKIILNTMMEIFLGVCGFHKYFEHSSFPLKLFLIIMAIKPKFSFAEGQIKTFWWLKVGICDTSCASLKSSDSLGTCTIFIFHLQSIVKNPNKQRKSHNPTWHHTPPNAQSNHYQQQQKKI